MQLLKRENNQKSILPLFAVGTFSLHILTLLLLMFHGTLLQQLSRRLTPQSLVQLADGRAITVDPSQNLERYPETIRRFVGQSMTLMLTWSQQQPPETVWEISSQLLAADAKQKIHSEVMNSNSANQFANRGAESVLIVQRISQPTKIEDGKWKVEMQANQLIFSNSDKLGKSIPFNKQILVQSTETQATSLPDLPLPWHLATYRLGEARLEIYNICDIKAQNCS
ncbi:hypothetical protein ACF3DV_20200 [Chlorogloeopsis fritschii PCC 9212]|uniref:Uncharacterized protein n=1 Tax=Chlorogloeopsis fritschii PCC 6912 TaxID=211165 RepID=A0A3S0Y5I7_CHLFR|nr:hypothetical protein [Chlorogloeopsis fritschii]RUR84624.1 hypothetical protein PCC6912_15190 [Chlorogloeopsis fritschii PCC 6912]